mgnify:CR=1 FL=1|tara:strand:+ start:1371 stop:2432 length:1062 start_codon:yes stop_codon:yes gene_type:complete
MENRILTQVVREVRRSLKIWDIKRAVSNTNDEIQTRINLINPLFDILGYDGYDIIHEYIVDIEGSRGHKVDMAITLGRKNPIVLIECKRATNASTLHNLMQVNDYSSYTKSVKIGILTNGLVFDFYTKDISKSRVGFNVKPFFSFNLEEYTGADLEMLALFHRTLIDTKIIEEKANEIYFLDNFDEALYTTLKMPKSGQKPPEGVKKLIEIIFRNMGGKRYTDNVLNELLPLVNSISLRGVLNRIIREENVNSNSGIITTTDEIKAYHIIKTILSLNRNIRIDIDRITYRDYKNSFKILIDDNQRKSICSIEITKTKKFLSVGNNLYEIQSISVVELTKYYKEIVEAAIKADS